MKWRLIDTGLNDAFMNMAIDEAILLSVEDGTAPSTLRFYGWSPPGLSIGYFQKIEDVDIERCRMNGIHVVRRPTGGRAVLHKDELTYSIVSRLDCSPFSGSLMENYRSIAEGLLQGLRYMGIEAEMVRRRNGKGLRNPACFSSPSFSEITVSGKKIIGSAQRRLRKAFLQHGSVLIGPEIPNLFNFLKSPIREKAGLNKSRPEITAVRLEIEAEIDDIKRAFVRGIEDSLKIKLMPSELSRHEIETARRLAAAKYASVEWNYVNPKAPITEHYPIMT